MNNVTNIRPAARRSDPITSHLADKNITLDGTKATQINQVYKAVKQFRCCTSRELSEITGLDRHMVGKRLSECTQIRHCHEDDKRRCIYSGKLALTWDLI